MHRHIDTFSKMTTLQERDTFYLRVQDCFDIYEPDLEYLARKIFNRIKKRENAIKIRYMSISTISPLQSQRCTFLSCLVHKQSSECSSPLQSIKIILTVPRHLYSPTR